MRLAALVVIAMLGSAPSAADRRCLRQACRQEWTAPDHWYINGVRPDGRYEVRPVLGMPENDLADAAARREIRDERRIVGWIWCWLPTTPRQDGHRVWCE